ncbi:MAG TPA: glycosyltransferase family 4 protein [Candidatus Binatia bacterium]|nr:glycosyltransferase family 4 protein [Candidatus Binatia bacterium]
MSPQDDNPALQVLIVSGIFPPDIGGPASYVPKMAAALLARGHRVTVVTLSDAPQSSDASYSFPVVRIRRSLFKPIRFLRTVAALVGAGWHADVLFVNGLYPEAVVANSILRKPQVQKWVGDWAWERATNQKWTRDTFSEFQERRGSWKTERLKKLRSFCVRRADAVIVPSRYLAATAARWGVAQEKVVTIYNAVEIDPPVPSVIPLSTQFKLVTVGRLIALKQIDRLIAAIRDRKNIGLVIIGDGPERGPLENLAREQGLTERIYFAGQKTNQETLSLMAGCDLFVLNSTHEGFPHVVLEAMSLGLPVIATAVGGTPELIHNGVNGVLVAVDSARALPDALDRLMASPAERARLVNGAKQTMERFRSSTMIDQTEAVLIRAWEKRAATARVATGFQQQTNG